MFAFQFTDHLLKLVYLLLNTITATYYSLSKLLGLFEFILFKFFLVKVFF